MPGIYGDKSIEQHVPLESMDLNPDVNCVRIRYLMKKKFFFAEWLNLPYIKRI